MVVSTVEDRQPLTTSGSAQQMEYRALFGQGAWGKGLSSSSYRRVRVHGEQSSETSGEPEKTF